MNTKNALIALMLAGCTSGAGSQVEAVAAPLADQPSDAVGGGPAGGPVGTPPTLLCDYPTAFGTPQNTGLACPQVRGMKVVAQYVQDESLDGVVAEAGFGQIHEGAPLTQGDYFLVPEHHAGNPAHPATDRKNDSYSVTVRRWPLGVANRTAVNVPVTAWSAKTTWQPTDSLIGNSFGSPGGGTNGFEMGFYPAIGNGSVYLPSLAGQVTRRDLATGALQAQVNPFAGMDGFDGDPKTIGINALQVAPNGNVYYNVISYSLTDDTFDAPKRGSWLVEVHPDNTSRVIPYSKIATAAIGVPQASAFCSFDFGTNGSPAPTSSASTPPQFHCGEQIPNFNAPVAVTPAGHLITYTGGNTSDGANFLIELDASLNALRSYDTRGHVLNGCGVLLTDANDDFCSIITDNFTTHIGFDPEQNEPVKLIGTQIMDDAPFVAPNGDVGVGGYNGGFSFGGGFDARGSIVVFKSDGTLRAVNQSFGWEVTPTVWQHNGGFSYLQDNNHYSDGVLSVGQFNPNMVLESNGTPATIATANAIDFLDTNVLLDADGRRYGVNGDGHVYAFDAAGTLVDTLALRGADGAVRSVETESGHGARDRAGRLYLSYAGSVYVVDGSGTDHPVPQLAASPRALARRSFARGLARD